MNASSKTSGWLSAEQVRLKLGMNDGRPVAGWVRKGLVKGHILGGSRKICMVHEISLIRFVVNPMNWPWFDRSKICDPVLRRLLERQAQRWGDEWLTPKKAGEITGLDVRQISQYVRLGRLNALHVVNKDGRKKEQGRWAFYFLLRSEVEKVKIYKHGDAIRSYTQTGLDWIKRATEMGWSLAAIARSMKRDAQTIRYWIRKYDLPKPGRCK
jgi:hypothetical protein